MRQGYGLRFFGALVFLLVAGGLASAQTPPSAPTVSYPSNSAVSQKLSDLPNAHWAQSPQDLKIAPPAKRGRPHGAGPGGGGSEDGALQKEKGQDVDTESKTNFRGIGGNGYIPPDPNIAVGKTNSAGGYIVQMVNSEIAVFNKSNGSPITGPVSLASMWAPLGAPCSNSNSGDPIVQYDAAADRWLISQLADLNAPYGECIGVSQTNDPTKAYNLYYYSFGTNLNDYPKFGVWPTATNSAYFASYNLFANAQNFIGANLCAYDRNVMLSGVGSPAQICGFVSNDGNFLPADLDGPTPPSNGTPGYFLNFETLSTLRLYQLSPNFTTKTATLTETTPDIGVAGFTEACSSSSTGVCIPQPGTTQKLDSLNDRLMYRLAYRVLGDHTAMVVNHSVTAGSSVGVRWYELRQSTAASNQCNASLPFSSSSFYLCQQGTFAPDSAYRWMGSAAMDHAGNIALAYSLSNSSTIYPSIAFTTRTPTMPVGTMAAETRLLTGMGAQTAYSRWGDYTALRIDPSDDTTFWYTNEYYTQNSPYLWSTAIVSFAVGAGGGGTPTPDFTLSASPNPLTVKRGQSGSATVTVTALSGSTPVSLSVSGTKKGTTATLTPTSVTPTGTSLLTVNAASNARTGTFTLTITGSNGSATHQTSLTLTVQ
jgi:hypothetical protein